MKEDIKDKLIKIAIFFGLFAFVVGAGCSVGWFIHYKEWFAMICDFVVIGFAIPTVIKLFKKLM